MKLFRFKNIINFQIKKFSTTKNVKTSQMPASEFTIQQYNGPSIDKIKTIRKDKLNPALSLYYKEPLLIHDGKMQWLFDHKGQRYLDMFGGIVTVSVGHCHPKVNAALSNQLNKLWHTTNIYMHPKIHEYAERLTSTLPGDLKVVYFVNSGSEANDLALLLARLYTKNFDVISFRNAYHGMSPYTMGLTGQSTWKYSVPGAGSGIHHAMTPDPYHGIWGGNNCRDSPVQTTRSCNCSKGECKATPKYIQQLEEILKYSTPKGKCAGMFAESIQGVGGTVQYTKDYIKQAAELIRKNGGVFISDEVQTGFGRTGEHYWGFEAHEIIPDIVTMAKGIGNGFPLAAVVTTPEIAQVMTQALHFNTYGGNPLASAVGIAVLDVIEEEKLQENSFNVGSYLLKGLENLRDKYEIVGDVRGKGLMIGVEMVKDKESKQPLSGSEFIEIWEKSKDLGVLFGKGGMNGNTLRIKPPMCITKDDANFSIEVLENAIVNYLNQKIIK